MRPSSTALRATALAAVLAFAGASQAAITVFTDEASFLAAVTGAGTDSFSDLVDGDAYEGPLARSAGSFGYAVSAGPDSNLLFGGGNRRNTWLTSDASTDTITFSGFSPAVGALSANVFTTNVAGNQVPAGRVVVTVTDGSGTTSQTLRRVVDGTFIGFVSDSGISSFTVTAEQGPFRDRWAAVDNFTLATPVPEPGTLAMLLAGLGVVSLLARRRNAS